MYYTCYIYRDICIYGIGVIAGFCHHCVVAMMISYVVVPACNNDYDSNNKQCHTYMYVCKTSMRVPPPSTGALQLQGQEGADLIRSVNIKSEAEYCQKQVKLFLV